jgi:ankyrin repeat protein
MVVCWGNLDVVQLLLENWADPNARDGAGHTPLICAVYRKNMEAMMLLLNSGADPNLADYQGDWPLVTA